MAHESILIVDDNEANGRLVSFVLNRAGYQVRVAAAVPEARQMIAESRPQLILMDIQLPGIDGLSYTRELKASPETRGITVVALTAYAMKGDEEKARAAGCDGYLSKPINTRTFAEMVAGYLAR